MSFWPSGTDVCIITEAVTTKLKGNFFGDPPFTHHIFSAGPPL